MNLSKDERTFLTKVLEQYYRDMDPSKDVMGNSNKKKMSSIISKLKKQSEDNGENPEYFSGKFNRPPTRYIRQGHVIYLDELGRGSTWQPYFIETNSAKEELVTVDGVKHLLRHLSRVRVGDIKVYTVTSSKEEVEYLLRKADNKKRHLHAEMNEDRSMIIHHLGDGDKFWSRPASPEADLWKVEYYDPEGCFLFAEYF